MNTEIPPALKERLDRLRTGMLLDLPFFGSLIVRMPFVRDDQFKTMATDGVSIKLNAEWSAACDDNQLRYTVAHELLHPALGHLWRLEGRDLGDFNSACDYVVNQMLDDYAADAVKQGRALPWVRPAGFLTVEKHPEYRGLGAEAIYDLIRKEKQEEPPPSPTAPPPSGSGSGNSQPQPGGQGAEKEKDEEQEKDAANGPEGQATPGSDPHPSEPGSFVPPPPDTTDPKPGTEAGGDNLEDDWKIAVAQAEQCSRMMGNCPGAATRLVNKLKEPEVSWQDHLREFMTRTASDDYSWSRVNRRHLGRGFILPKLHSQRMGRVVFAADSSGSIVDMVKPFLQEGQALLDMVRPEALDVLICDAKVHQSLHFEPGDEVKLDDTQRVGGGGTDFRPVFDWIEHGSPEVTSGPPVPDAAASEPPVCLVFLTDLCGTFPDKEPEYPVLWIGYQTAGCKPPWGEFCKIS